MNKAIIILFEGNEPKEDCVMALAEVLRDFHVIKQYEDCEVKVVDDVNTQSFVKACKRVRSASEVALENALIYIRERFKRELSLPELSTFTISVTNIIVMWSVRLDNHMIDLSNGNSEMVNAVKIIGKANLSSPRVKSLISKVGINPTAVRIVKMIYDRYFGCDVSR